MTNAKNKTKISIIMPVYNVEEYVSKAIESVLGQTLREFEFLIVDDGSTDNSGTICDEYALKDKRIKVVHKENGGAPTARNVAIEMAKSKYLYFIDSDDWIEKDYLEKMYKLMIKNDADLVVTGFLMEYSDNGKTTTYSTKSSDRIYATQEDFRKNAYKYFDNSLFGLPWNKLFRRDVVLKENIRFPDAKWDDTHFNLDYLMNVKRVVVSSMAKYHWYRSRPGAETMIIYSDVNMFKTRLAHYEHILQLYRHWGMENDYQSRDAIDSYFVGRVFQCIQELADNQDLGGRQKRERTAKILNNKIVRDALENAKSLSPKLRILVWPMRINNITLCLLYGRMIGVVRKYFKTIFIRLKEKEVHGR